MCSVIVEVIICVCVRDVMIQLYGYFKALVSGVVLDCTVLKGVSNLMFIDI